MSATAKEKILRAAEENRWTVHTVPADRWEPYEFRRRNGTSHEFLLVWFTLDDQVREASWAPRLDGFHGRGVGHRRPNKLAWVLNKIGERRRRRAA